MYSITLWLFLLCIVLILLLALLHVLLKDKEFDKIQGPSGVFLLGNALDMLRSRVALFTYFRGLSQIYKNNFKFNLMFLKYVVIYSPEEAEKLLSGIKNNEKGYSYKFLKPWLKDGLLLSDGNKWEKRRKILNPAFHFNVLQYYNKSIVARCNMLVNKLEAEMNNIQTETTMGASLDEELNNFGIKYKNAIHDLGFILYKRVTNIWLHPDFIFNHSYTGYKQKKLLYILSSFRNRVIQNRKNEPLRAAIGTISDENDEFFKTNNKLIMLDILLKAADEGKIDDEGICEEVDNFIFEGHDTTSSALQFTLMILANHQDVQDKIVKEHEEIYGSSGRSMSTLSDLSKMKYLECCIKETLRLYPPVFFIIRRITEPVQLKDYICPAGVEMVLSIYDLHRQADQFVEPLKFVPERFMTEPTWHRFAYLPFSAGPRNCIGQKLAMMEMKLVISSVLQKYRLLPITKPEDIEIVSDIVLRPKDPIYIKFVRRHQTK